MNILFSQHSLRFPTDRIQWLGDKNVRFHHQGCYHFPAVDCCWENRAYLKFLYPTERIFSSHNCLRIVIPAREEKRRQEIRFLSCRKNCIQIFITPHLYIMTESTQKKKNSIVVSGRHQIIQRNSAALLRSRYAFIWMFVCRKIYQL